MNKVGLGGMINLFSKSKKGKDFKVPQITEKDMK